MSSRDIVRAINREIEAWPGVTHYYERGSKHPRIVLSYGGRSTFRTFAGSPSDGFRAGRNCISELRRTLRDLGAARTPQPANRRQREPACAVRR